MSDLKNNSILSDIKDYLGLNPNEVDPDFDNSIISHINTSIAELAQLGLRELGDFTLNSADDTWNDLLGDEYQYVYAFARNYIEVNTKLLWDTPQSGALKAALDEKLSKATFNVMTAIEHHNIMEGKS